VLTKRKISCYERTSTSFSSLVICRGRAHARPRPAPLPRDSGAVRRDSTEPLPAGGFASRMVARPWSANRALRAHFLKPPRRSHGAAVSESSGIEAVTAMAETPSDRAPR
jgi:hypothetical protein